MMSNFLGCDNLVTIPTTTTTKITMFLLFILSLFLGSPTAVVSARSDDSLIEMSSREGIVQMAGYGEEKLSTVLISGTVICHSCLDGKTQPRPVSGASVAVFCGGGIGKTKKPNWARGTSDEYGHFLIDLPSHLHAIPNLEKVCLVKVFQLPNSSACHPSFTGKHKSLKLSSVGDGIRLYTAQRIHLTPKSSPKCEDAMVEK